MLTNSPEYIAALEALKIHINAIKLSAYELLADAFHRDTVLSHCGYKSKEDAATKIMVSAQKTIDKLYKDFEKKYPD
jgi:hypothetical protein